MLEEMELFTTFASVNQLKTRISWVYLPTYLRKTPGRLRQRM